jgi:uncharacterized membrane protein HdeD (DUF308 family)
VLMSPEPQTETLSRDDVVQISKTWWVFLIMGTLSVIAGVILLEVDWTLKNLAYFVGAIFIVRGLFDIAARPVDGAPRSWSVGTGVVNIVMGVILLAWPEPTFRVIAAIIGIWLLIAGVVLVVGSIANHGSDSLWWFSLFVGGISIVLGIWAIRRPGLTLSIIIVLTAIWAIIMGTLEIAAAFEVKRLPKRFDKLANATP